MAKKQDLYINTIFNLVKMTEQFDLSMNFNEWRQKLNLAVRDGSGYDIEQATRMVFSLGVIAKAYRPEILSQDVLDEIGPNFVVAVSRIEQMVQSGDFGDDTREHCLGYQRNVIARREELHRTLYKEQ